MTSQVSNSKAVRVSVTELVLGDVIMGLNYTIWDNRWEITKLPEGTGAISLSFEVHKIVNGQRSGTVSYWHPYKNAVAIVQDRMLQYDPTQQGDTDEDI